MEEKYSDINLYFDEGQHKYTDSLGNNYISVTTIIHNYVPEFDEKYWLRRKAKEQKVSEKEIKRQWDKIKDEACNRGTITHNGLEDAIKETSKFKNAIKYLRQTEGRVITVADVPLLIPTPLDIDKFIEATNNKYPEIYRVFEYYTAQNYTIYSEIGVFNPELLISGTIDLFLVRPSDFVILDWKTNRDGLKFESGYYKKDKTTFPNQLTNEWVRKYEYMLPPLNCLENCNGMHYSLQLSMYARLAEMILGIPCTGLGLCHIASPFILNGYGQPLRDKDGYHIDPYGEENVQWYRIEYLKKEVESIFHDRTLEVRSMKKPEQLTMFDDGQFMGQMS